MRALRVAAPRDFWQSSCARPVARLVGDAIDSLAAAGAEVEEVALGVSILQVMATGYLITLSEAAAYHLPTLRSGRPGYGHEFGLVLRAGLLMPDHAHAGAQKARRVIAARVDDVLERYDVLVMPTVGAVADAIPEGPRPLTRRITETPTPQYTWLANLHRGPAVSVPCGLTEEGLPAGLQVMGRRGDDAAVLRAARGYEMVSAWGGAHPPRWP